MMNQDADYEDFNTPEGLLPCVYLFVYCMIYKPLFFLALRVRAAPMLIRTPYSTVLYGSVQYSTRGTRSVLITVKLLTGTRTV